MTDSPEHHRQRSEFIRGLVQRSVRQLPISDPYTQGIPRTIVQFWHDLRELPEDIDECIASWVRWTTSGFKHHLFDEHSARAFIRASLGAHHARAFERCYHPAMQADYFRLCYLLVEGGLYVDADDVCGGTQIGWLFDDGQRWPRAVGQFFSLFKWILCGLSCRITQRQVEVNRVGRFPVKRGMRPAAVVKIEVPGQRLPRVADRLVAV